MNAFAKVNTGNIARFASLYASVFNAPPWHDGWSVESASERLHAFSVFPAFHGMGLLRAAEPVGLVLGWGERWTTGWVFHLKEMCVHPASQGQGLGTQLMSAVEEKLRRHGFRGIHLQTGREVPARLFYERSGFQPSDLVTLRKRLV